jgi:hypothetical protein
MIGVPGTSYTPAGDAARKFNTNAFIKVLVKMVARTSRIRAREGGGVYAYTRTPRPTDREEMTTCVK